MTKLQSVVSAALLTMAGGYSWACYVAGDCICAVAGSCYAKTVLPNCQLPTCIIADSSAVAWNVCPGNGSYQGRELLLTDGYCMPATCRVYDRCNQQYVALSGSSCWFSIQNFQGVGSGCY
jgi:hypothetical protein